jgi:hypothetical protein
VDERRPVTLELRGAWSTESYVVGTDVHEVTGVLLLTADQWATLYFVPSTEGPWGSAEAGTYTWDGQRLTFHHRLVFQGGGGRELEVALAADRSEECTVDVSEDRCAVHFPCGNVLHLRRTGA